MWPKLWRKAYQRIEPLRVKRKQVWAVVLAAFVMLPLCAGPVWVGAQQIDLLHIAFINSCAFRAYEFHLQDQQRYPEHVRYDFTNSPDSLIVAIVWIENGPTINLSQPIPLTCS